MPKPQPISRIDTWMNLLHFLLSALTIFVGVWKLFHQGFQGIGASWHYFGDGFYPDLRDKLLNYKEHQGRHKIVITGRHVLPGTATDTASGVSDDENDNKHRVVLPGFGVPELGHHMFSVSQASKAGLATIIDSRSPLDKDNTPYHCDSWTRNQDIFFFHIDRLYSRPNYSGTFWKHDGTIYPTGTREFLAQKKGTR